MDINVLEKIFRQNIVNTKSNISKSYYKNSGNEWKTSRCRIDPCFWADVLTELITKKNHKKSNDINEYYLSKTRKISNKKRDYKNSHQMDINAIKSWFKINDKLEEECINTINQYSYNAIKFVITNYINEVIRKENLHNDLTKSWEEKQKNEMWLNELSYSKPNDFYTQGNEIVENSIKNRKWNIIENHQLYKPKIVSNKVHYLANSEVEHNYNEINEIIGLHGEKIAYEFLKSKYGETNVNWISRDKKYYPFDFKININQENFYIEVKSTKKHEMEIFFLSINEYNFYKENINNYKLLFIWNLYETRQENVIPLLFLEKPQFEISLTKEGFDGEKGIIYIVPNNFKSSIYNKEI